MQQTSALSTERLLAAPSEEKNREGWDWISKLGGLKEELPGPTQRSCSDTCFRVRRITCRVLDVNLDLTLWEMRGTFFGGAAQTAACWRVWMLGSTGTTKDTEFFPTRRFNKEYIRGFHFQWGFWNRHTVEIPSPCFFDAGFTICLPDVTPCGSGVRTEHAFTQMSIPSSKITWVPQ